MINQGNSNSSTTEVLHGIITHMINQGNSNSSTTEVLHGIITHMINQGNSISYSTEVLHGILYTKIILLYARYIYCSTSYKYKLIFVYKTVHLH